MLLEKDYFFFCDVDGLCGHISLEGGGGGGGGKGQFPCEDSYNESYALS